MNLYVWRSACLKNYGRGTIVVMAPDVEQARTRVREEFPKYYTERYPYSDMNDHDDAVSYRAAWFYLEEDIAGEPQVIASGVQFIEGSE